MSCQENTILRLVYVKRKARKKELFKNITLEDLKNPKVLELSTIKKKNVTYRVTLAVTTILMKHI